MKKIICIFIIMLLFGLNAQAEVYHGIDIDKIYSQSDWSSKEKIKETIDDYILLCAYQKKFDSCARQTERFSCYDDVAEKILTNLYVYPDNNIETYKQFRQKLSEVYSIQSCLNKYEWPSGNLCEANSRPEILKVLHFYIQSLINGSKEKLLLYLPELKSYK